MLAQKFKKQEEIISKYVLKIFFVYIEGGKIEKRVFQAPSAARPQRPALIGRDSHPLLSAASCTRSRFSLIYSVPAVKLCVWWELPQ